MYRKEKPVALVKTAVAWKPGGLVSKWWPLEEMVPGKIEGVERKGLQPVSKLQLPGIKAALCQNVVCGKGMVSGKIEGVETKECRPC